MKKTHLIGTAFALASISVAAEAKKAPQPTALELQQLQGRDIEGTKDQVFGAVMSVLQDSGYRIQAADKDTGLITGVASTKSKTTWAPFVGFGKSKKSPIASVFIEAISPTVTHVRISFVMAKVKSSLYGSSPQDEEPIYEPSTYQAAFEQINKTVFIRRGMNAPSATAASPIAPIAPAVISTAK